MAPKALEIGAAYIRVSTDDQTELSPDAQLRVILDEAKKDGFVIPPEYIFEEKKGISGRKADNRPEFQKMIAIAKSQSPAPFKRLYLWKFSRFARNQEESTFYKGILRKKCGVEIKSVSEPIMEGMFGRLIETIIEWFDEYYSYNLSGEVVRGMTEKALRQGYQSSPSLGYEAVGEGKAFVINEETYKIVEYIFQSYYDGKDMTAIARACNEHHWRTRRGNPFERRTISRILQNQFYNGTVLWNGYSFQGTHEVRPSVTKIFPAVQERIRAEYRPLKRREVSSCGHWLSGLLVCSVCGASLSLNRVRSNHGSDFFQCWKYSKGLHPGSCAITAAKAEQLLLHSIKTVLESESVEYEYLPPETTAAVTEQDLITDALDKVALKELRIKEAYEAGIDTLEEYKENKLRLAAEREELLQKLQEAAPSPQAKIPDQDEVLRRIQSAYDLFSDPNVDFEIKGNALRKIVKKIIYDRQNGEFKVIYYI